MFGYSHVFAYIGEEGYMLNCQLREGQKHSQYNTPEFLRKTLEMAKSLNLPYDIIVRMDSGFDSGDNLAVCEEFEVMYLIKRNPRKETGEKWLEIAEENYSECYDIQYGKKVYIGSIDKEIADSGEGKNLKLAELYLKLQRKVLNQTDSYC